jgi:SynChlorMet cassette radical SAM/SPASM protein ScmF
MHVCDSFSRTVDDYLWSEVNLAGARRRAALYFLPLDGCIDWGEGIAACRSKRLIGETPAKWDGRLIRFRPSRNLIKILCDSVSSVRDRTNMNEVTEKYPLNQIYFYLTEGCNLACRHCWIAPKFQTEDRSYPVLSVDLFKSIVEHGKPLGLSGVKLTGGEPLMHPEISDILEHMKSEDLNLTIETNGVLCTPEIAQQIAACKNTFVSVSIDGADAETHEWVRGVPGCFEAALNGARHLVEAGIRLQIIMSIMRRNVDQMEAVVRIAESVGAGSLKFNPTQPIARGEKLRESGATLTIEELVDLGVWIENDLSESTSLTLFPGHPAAFRPLGKMFGENGDGCSRCGILGILGVLADGSYALCGIGETVPELVFGHAEKDSLKDIWETTDVLNQLREGLTDRLEGICGDCVMKGLCLGECIAQNFYRSKHLWTPFWYCAEAEEAGLFPETRRRPDPE